MTLTGIFIEDMPKKGAKRKIESDREDSNEEEANAATPKTRKRGKSNTKDQQDPTKKSSKQEKQVKESNGSKRNLSRDRGAGNLSPAHSQAGTESSTPERMDSDEGLQCFAEEDDEFNTSEHDQSQSQSAVSQVSSEESGIAPLGDSTMSEEEERIDQLVAEASGDSQEESDSEVQLNAAKSPAKPKKSAKIGETKQKKTVVIQSPILTGKNVSERQKKQLQEITEFFNGKGAINKAWKMVKELKNKELTPRKSRNEADTPAEENTNSNAESDESARRPFQFVKAAQEARAKEGQPRKSLPLPPPTSRDAFRNREGIDASLLYKPRLSRSEITVYSMGTEQNAISNQGDLENRDRPESKDDDIFQDETSEESDLSKSDESDLVVAAILNSSDETRGSISDEEPRMSRREQAGHDSRDGANQSRRSFRSPQRDRSVDDRRRSVKRQTAQRIEQADRTKTEAIKPEGKVYEVLKSLGGEFAQLAIDIQTIRNDNEFDPLAAEIDEITTQEMKTGKYVDLKKLLPKETFFEEEEEDCRYQLAEDKSGGPPKIVKAKSESERQGINSIKKWLVGINIYATAYCKQNPHKAPELFQYILDIQDAAVTYTWESVYVYDRVIRKLMDKNPGRRWNTPHVKYFNKLMKPKNWNNGAGNARRASDGFRPKREICWKYNKGKCQKGESCHRDHKCNFCGKFGHGEHVCRLKKKKDGDRADKEKEREHRDK